jgi:hypothetical protein
LINDKTLLLALLASLHLATSAAAQDLVERPKSIRWPGEGGKTVDISLGIVLVDFARINIREESFDMAGYLDTSWTDPSLALRRGEPAEGVRRFRPGQIWAPELEFVNAVEQVKAEREGDLYVSDDGRVTQRVRFSHKFQSPLNLQRFPFDEQTLKIVVAPFDPFARDLHLVIDEGRVGSLEEASVTDWSIDHVGARIVSAPGGDAADKRFLFEVKIARRSTYYIWRVLVPMTLLVLASWTVFWFEVKNLQPQISTGLAILLSLVTFNYAIDFSLPKVPYLTFIDRYTLTCFAFVLSDIFVVAAIHVALLRRGEALASRLQRVARWTFVPVLIVAIATLAITSLR